LGNYGIVSAIIRQLLGGDSKWDEGTDGLDPFDRGEVIRMGPSLVLEAKEESTRAGQAAGVRDETAIVVEDYAMEPCREDETPSPNLLQDIAGTEIRTADSLAPFTNDKDPEVRQAAIIGLGEIGDPRAVDVLKEALKAADWQERRVIAGALSQLGWEYEKNEAGLLYCLARGDWQACATIGKFALPHLISALQSDDDAEVRVSSALALGAIGDYSVTEPLIHALKDAHAKVREAAATSLGRAKRRKAAEPLFEALEDLDPGVVSAAGSALIEIGEASLEPLVAALRDHDGDRRARAVAMLFAVGDIPELQGSLQRILISALSDSDKWSRIRTASALGDISKEWAVKPLIEALYYYGVRESAREALVKIGNPGITPLIGALRHRHIVVRRAAAEILGEIGGARSLKPLEAALRDKDWCVREAAQSSLSSLKSRGITEDSTVLQYPAAHFSEPDTNATST
jgi:HEAT repeat protein